MSKHHDENKDLRLVSRVAKVDYSNKTIRANKSAVIGIRTLGRIDYLVNYCGWFFYWDNSVAVRIVPRNDEDNSNKSKRVTKKITKEPKLKDKRKR